MRAPLSLSHFRLLVFDWDGTLMDSAARIVASMRGGAADLGLAVPTPAAVREVIGLGLGESVDRLWPGAPEALRRRMIERYRYHYLVADTTPTPLFAGVAETLEQLSVEGYRLAVATGKGRRGLDNALRESGLAHLFAASRCADETVSKPHPQMLLELMEELDSVGQETLVVGDTEYDMAMARNAGAVALAVGYGVHKGPRLLREGAVGLLPDIRALRPWLQQTATPPRPGAGA